MAKFIVTFEKNEIKKELFFSGEIFSYSMIPTETGSKGNAKCFEAQLEGVFVSEDEELLEAASQLDFGDEEDIEDALSVLDDFEYRAK